MFEKKRTKKDFYDASLYDQRTYINGEIAMKPYYYLRNGLLHVRYTVDRCVELSPAEVAKLKVDMTASPENKQSVLEKAWNFFTTCVGKTVIHDGVAELEKRMKGFAENGHKN